MRDFAAAAGAAPSSTVAIQGPLDCASYVTWLAERGALATRLGRDDGCGSVRLPRQHLPFAARRGGVPRGGGAARPRRRGGFRRHRRLACRRAARPPRDRGGG